MRLFGERSHIGGRFPRTKRNTIVSDISEILLVDEHLPVLYLLLATVCCI